MPSAQQPIARLGSLRRTCETRPPVHTPNRLSAIMDIEIPKSTERNVTMALSEIPSKLLNPAAQLLAGETPERLVNFRVSLHPLVGTMGMSVAQAVREGFAMLVDKSITPSRIAESDQTRLQSIAENPTNSLHLSANSATPGEESTTDMSGRSYQRKTCQSSKAVRFSDEDDIFHLSPARSQGSLGDKKCSISSSGGHPEGDGLASQETNDLCALKRMQNANKPESRIEADPDIPVLPELNFGRASGDFGSLFANFQGELQLVVPRNPDLPGLAQETDRSNKGACSDAHDASDTNDADDELDVEDVLGYFLDDSAQSDGIRDRTCREHSMLRCDSPTVGNGQTDLVMQADSSIIGSGIFRKFPLLPGPPPSLPLPHLPPVRTITASRGSAFTVVTPHRPQQQRRQGSREFTPAGPAVPVSSKQPGLEIPSAYSQPTSSQQATSSYSKTFQSSSKVHTHQLIKEPQTSSALSRIEIPKSDTIFIHSSLLQLSGPSLEPSAFLHLPDPHESSSSFPTPLLSSDGPVNPFPDYSSSESSYRPEDKVIKFPIYQQSLEDLRTQRLRREAEDADSRQRSQRLVTRPNFPFISGTESLLPAPLKLTRSLQGPLTPGSPKSTGMSGEKSFPDLPNHFKILHSH